MDSDVLDLLRNVVLSAGGSAAILYALFKKIGERWIEDRFAERLQKLKHEQNKEIEEFKFKISTLFDRMNRIHEKEFEVIPQAWHRLIEAFSRVNAFVNGIQFAPGLDGMDDEELDEFLSTVKIKDSEKREIRNVGNKDNKYIEIIFWYNLRDVKEACREFHVYIQKNGIFIGDELKEKFSELDDMLWKSLAERQVGHRHNDLTMWVKASELMSEKATPIRKEIEEIVQNRLRSAREVL